MAGSGQAGKQSGRQVGNAQEGAHNLSLNVWFRTATNVLGVASVCLHKKQYCHPLQRGGRV